MLQKLLSDLKIKVLHGLVIAVIMFFVSIPFYGEFKNRLASSELLLNMYKTSLETEITRYKFLPFILSQNEKFNQILTGEIDKVESGFFLQRIKYATNVATIYVLDRAGNAVASSNWDSANSYIGENYSSRPYFLGAMAGRLGQFYGTSMTTAKPGFFIAYGLRQGEEIVGAITIEIDLSDLEQVWGSGPDEVLVYDVNDIIFLSSNRQWKHKTFRRDGTIDVDPSKLPNKLAKEQIDDVSLVKCYRFGDVTFYRDPVFGCLFPGKTSIEEQIIDYAWTIVSLKRTGYYYASALLVFLISMLIYAIIIFAYRHFRNQFKRSIQKLRNQVVENSKLAAIGQMATEIAHEFNQPLSAIYMLLDTSRLMLKNNQYREADGNLELVSSHIERLTQQISELKSFASRHRVPRGSADIVAAANSSVLLFQLTLKKHDVKLTFVTSQSKMLVPCNEIGLEQIFSNLITNAIDAMAQKANKSLSILIGQQGETVLVKVRDNGDGIPDPSKIFESFYSTKQRGTGLGLAIVNGIVENSGGSISVRNHPEGGAEFTLTWEALRPTPRRNMNRVSPASVRSSPDE